MTDVPFLTYVLVFLAVLGTYLVVAMWMQAPEGRDPAQMRSLPALFRIGSRLVDVIAEGFGTALVLFSPARTDKWRTELLKSGYPLTVEQLFASQFLMAGLFGFSTCFIVFLLSGKGGISLCLGGVAALIGWVRPTLQVRTRAKARQTEIIKTLPFAIDLLTSAMQAGLDFQDAVRLYVQMIEKGALAYEFSLLLHEMHLGKSRIEGLEKMATHVQTQEFISFVAAVTHGSETGSSIVETLRVQGEDMRRARFNLAEQKAARAPSIMIFPIVLFILPSTFAIVIVPVILRMMAAKGGM